MTIFAAVDVVVVDDNDGDCCCLDCDDDDDDDDDDDEDSFESNRNLFIDEVLIFLVFVLSKVK